VCRKIDRIGTVHVAGKFYGFLYIWRLCTQ